MNQSRGYRNNNPGNIRMTSIPWVGKIPHAQNTDHAFEQFQHLKYGIRAMILDIRGKMGKGINTIEKLLAIYAPINENNTAAYVANVAKLSGLPANSALPINKDTLRKVIIAMTQVENGSAISLAQFEEAWGVMANTATEVGKKASPASSHLASSGLESGYGEQAA